MLAGRLATPGIGVPRTRPPRQTPTVRRLLGPLALGTAALLLAGCTATRAPAPTVTVTAAAARPSVKPGDSAAWDLSALCAAESELDTVDNWRRQQTEAKRLTADQAKAVAQSVAVQALELQRSGLPSSVAADAQVLADAAGTLEHPSLDLAAPAVRRAQTHITRVCSDNGLTIGILAQGG